MTASRSWPNLAGRSWRSAAPGAAMQLVDTGISWDNEEAPIESPWSGSQVCDGSEPHHRKVASNVFRE